MKNILSVLSALILCVASLSAQTTPATNKQEAKSNTATVVAKSATLTVGAIQKPMTEKEKQAAQSVILQKYLGVNFFNAPDFKEKCDSLYSSSPEDYAKMKEELNALEEE